MTKIDSSGSMTALKQFSAWFNQDSGLLFKDFRTGAAAYVETLSLNQRRALRLELSAFLTKHEDLPPNSLKRLWLSEGAQWCQRGINMRDALNELVKTL